VGDEILELQQALLTAQAFYRLLAERPGAAPVGRGRFLIGEIRAALKWLLADGRAQDEAILARLDRDHRKARSQDAVALALFEYAALADRHRDRIEGLGGLEAGLIDEARGTSTALQEHSAGPIVPETDGPAQALDLRNRIGALLYDRMRRVRAAARFVYRHDPAIAREVTSAYKRRQRSGTRRGRETRDESDGRGVA
jgi:hypothetical protein